VRQRFPFISTADCAASFTLRRQAKETIFAVWRSPALFSVCSNLEPLFFLYWGNTSIDLLRAAGRILPGPVQSRQPMSAKLREWQICAKVSQSFQFKCSGYAEGAAKYRRAGAWFRFLIHVMVVLALPQYEFPHPKNRFAACFADFPG
jgi:hypothetical protein